MNTGFMVGGLNYHGDLVTPRRRIWATFGEAEKAARRAFARGSENCQILAVKKVGRPICLAYVADDALGRVWTDLTNEGASLV